MTIGLADGHYFNKISIKNDKNIIIHIEHYLQLVILKKGSEMTIMKFTDVQGPAIAGVVREKNVRDAICSIKNCELKGATVIDLHLSTLLPELRNEQSIREIVKCTDLPILALNYAQNYDYSAIPDMQEEERINLLREAAKAGVSAVDIQGYTFDLPSKSAFHGDKSLPFVKDGIKELVTDEDIIAKQTELIDEFHQMGIEVLLSNHYGVPMKAEEVVALAKFVEKRKPDVIKIVTPSTCEEDNVEALKAMLMLKKEISCKVSYHLSGKCGRISRIVNPMMGGFMMFCVDRYGVNNLPEQLDLSTASEVTNKLKRLL